MKVLYPLVDPLLASKFDHYDLMVYYISPILTMVASDFYIIYKLSLLMLVSLLTDIIIVFVPLAGLTSISST